MVAKQWLPEGGQVMIEATEVQKIIYEYGERASIPRSLLILPTAPVGDGSPHLEISDGMYHLIYSERGFEFGRKSSAEIDDLLYWFFDDVCSNVSFGYELENRIEGQDCRRIAFSRKQELLRAIKSEWEERVALDIREILKNNPFEDR
jgi:hypothetical protein